MDNNKVRIRQKADEYKMLAYKQSVEDGMDESDAMDAAELEESAYKVGAFDEFQYQKAALLTEREKSKVLAEALDKIDWHIRELQNEKIISMKEMIRALKVISDNHGPRIGE